MKACGGEGIVPFVRNINSRGMWVVIFTLWPVCCRENGPRHPLNRELGGPQIMHQFIAPIPSNRLVFTVYGTTDPGPSYRAHARTHTHTHHWFKNTLPNIDQAHDKHQWTTTNFSPVQLYTPWWWIAYDPKYVGVIFNFMYFKLLYNVDFNL